MGWSERGNIIFLSLMFTQKGMRYVHVSFHSAGFKPCAMKRYVCIGFVRLNVMQEA